VVPNEFSKNQPIKNSSQKPVKNSLNSLLPPENFKPIEFWSNFGERSLIGSLFWRFFNENA
jgi:hypothetical protein